MISPYVIAAIGERRAHYYFLTGERFSAEEAKHLGLIQQITDRIALMSIGMMLAKKLLENSPVALAEAKKLIRYVAKEKSQQILLQKTAEHLAIEYSLSQEGLQHFWRNESQMERIANVFAKKSENSRSQPP